MGERSTNGWGFLGLGMSLLLGAPSLASSMRGDDGSWPAWNLPVVAVSAVLVGFGVVWLVWQPRQLQLNHVLHGVEMPTDAQLGMSLGALSKLDPPEVMELVRAARIEFVRDLIEVEAERGKPIRSPREVWESGRANTLEIALLCSALLTRAGLRCWLALEDTRRYRHAWLVVRESDAADDVESPARRRIDSATELASIVEANGDFYNMLDMSALCVSIRNDPFGEAGTVDDARRLAADATKRLRSLRIADISFALDRPNEVGPRTRTPGDRRVAFLQGTAAIAVAAVLTSATAGVLPGPDEPPSPPGVHLAAADLPVRWVRSTNRTVQVDPVRGVRQSHGLGDDWFLGETPEGDEFWTSGATELTRYSAKTGERVGSVRWPVGQGGPRRAPEGGWSRGRAVVIEVDGSSLVRHVVGPTSSTPTVSTLRWRYPGSGEISVAARDFGEQRDVYLIRGGGQTVMNSEPGRSFLLVDDGRQKFESVPLDLPECASPASTLSPWVGERWIAVACGEVVLRFDTRNMSKQPALIELPELGSSTGWKFAGRDLLGPSAPGDHAPVLLWSDHGFVDLDLGAGEVRNRTPRMSMWRQMDVSQVAIDDVWALPRSAGAPVALLLTRRTEPSPEGTQLGHLESLSADLDEITADTVLPLPASNVEVAEVRGRPVLIASGEWCCEPLRVDTVFVDALANRALSRMNAGTDVALWPAGNGTAWLFDLPGRRLVRVGGDHPDAIVLGIPSDGGTDGWRPERASIEYSTDASVVVRYWDDGRWHLLAVDPAGNSSREIAVASAVLEVRGATPADQTPWILEQAVADFGETSPSTMRRVDLTDGRVLAVVTLDLPPSYSAWGVLPDSGLVALTAQSLVRMDGAGALVGEVDLRTVTVTIDGVVVPIAPTDDIDRLLAGIAIHAGTVWMLRADDAMGSTADTLIPFDPATLQVAGATIRRVDVGAAIADRALWPLHEGLAVVARRGDLDVFSDGERHEITSDVDLYRLLPGAVAVVVDGQWVWIDGPQLPERGTPDAECGTDIDQPVRSSDERFWLCPGSREVRQARDGATTMTVAYRY